MSPTIEPFEPRHAGAVIELIGAVFEEYRMTFDPHGFDGDLLDVRGHYEAHGGWFSVLVDGDRVVGTVAAVPHGDGWEIKRLYLGREHRGRGHGRRLLEHALSRVAAAGGREAEAWSDARLETAHAVYARLGFQRIGERTLADIDRSVELGFRWRLANRPRPAA